MTGPSLLPLGHHEGKPPIPLVRPVIVIGSRSNARIHLVSSTVSKAHALLVRSGGRWYIRDLASRTKVIINGQPVRETFLEDGDELVIGKFLFRFRAGSAATQAAPTEPAPAKLEVAGSDFPVPIDERVVLIGRRSSADIPLLEDTVSTAHAVIFESDGQRFIRDLGSRTGTFVNNVSTHQHQLSPGDTIRVGETEMRYMLNDVVPAVVVEETPLGVDLSEPDLPAAAPVADDSQGGDLALKGPGLVEVLPAPAETDAALEPAEVAPDEPIPTAEPAEEAPLNIAPMAEPPTAIAPSADEAITPPVPDEHDLVEPLVPEELPRRGWHSPVADKPTTPEPMGLAEPETGLKFPDAIADADISAPVIDLSDVESPPAKLVPEPLIVQPPSATEGIGLPLAGDELELAASVEKEPVAPATIPLDISPPANEEAQSPVLEPPGIESAKPPILDLLGSAAAPVVEEIPIEVKPDTTAHEDSPRPLIAAIELPPAHEPAADQPSSAPADSAMADVAKVEPEPAAVEPAATKPARRRGRKKKEPVVRQPPAAPETPAEALPVAPAAPVAEVIEPTEPTKESALESAAAQLEIDSLQSGSVVEISPSTDELTDTSFGRAVEEFTGDKIGAIVEAAPEEASPSPQPEAPSTPVSAGEQTVPSADELIDETLALEPTTVEVPEVQASELVLPEAPPVELPPVPEIAEEVAPPVVPEPVAPRRAQVPWGANQDNFLGGRPLELTTPSVEGAGAGAEEAVKELISELDTAAAAAEAAAAAPPVEDDLPPIIPAIPPRPRNLASRPRRKTRDEEVLPLNLAEGEPGGAAPKFEGLGMSGIREMDVFSQMSPPAVDSAGMVEAPSETPLEPITPRRPRNTPAGQFRSGGGMTITADAEVVESAPRLKVVPEIPSLVDGATVSERRPSVTFAVEQTEAEAAAVRRKYFRRAAALLTGMLVLIGASAYVIYNYVGIRTAVEGSLNYRNLAALTKLEQQRFQLDQYRTLKDDSTFNRSRRVLVQRAPSASYGFLESRREYLKVMDRAAFTEDRPNVLLLRIEGNDPVGDKARVSAVMAAMYDQTKYYVDQARASRENLAQVQETIARYQRQVDDLNGEIEKLRLIGEARPTSQQIAELEQRIAEREAAWNGAVIAVKAAEGELARLRSAPGGDATQGNAPVATIDEDEKIRAMQSELVKLQEQVAASRAANLAQATEARKQLDAALEAFQKRVADAQGTMNASPELVAFVQSAQKLQETTRQLTDDLIRRQEQQFTRLTSLKDSLNDKMEQRRIESWQNDKQLQDLTEQLAILTRKYNAALGGGLEKESDDLKVEIDLTNNMIKARRELLPGDAFYADAIRQLQVIIDSTQKNIEEDRKKTEALLTALQQGFTSSESIEKLPAEQKQLAEALQKQVEQVNQARQEYNQAVDRGAADADAQLKQQIATLQAGIDARRHALAEENVKSLRSQQEQSRLDAIAAKEKELAALNDAEAAARKAFFDKHKELRDAQNLIAQARSNSEKLDTLIRQKDQAQRGLQASIDQLPLKKQQADQAVEPVEPTDNDVIVRTGQDMRLTYTLVSGGVILLVFCGLILWTLHTASLQVPGVTIHAADLGPATDAPANGQPQSKPANGSDEDHQPAVV